MPAVPGAQHRGRRLLHRFHEGSLACGDRRAEVRFIVDGATGGIVIPVEASFAKGGSDGELVLCAPDEANCAWQASLTPRVIERPESEEAVDRWAAYHAHHAHHPGHSGSSSGRTWVRCVATGLKAGEQVFDEDELMQPNALRTVEARLVKAINSDRAALTKACKVHGPLDVADPLAVGVDPLGVDVRARFGIVRLEFPDNISAGTEPQAKQALGFLLEGKAWGAGGGVGT